MSTGIKIGKFVKSQMTWNLTVGYETGIDIDEVQESLLHGNIAIGKEAIEAFGEGIVDVAMAVTGSKDQEALAALGDILASPKYAVSAWAVLAKKYGQTGQIGRFVLGSLSGVLSQASYSLLKLLLQSHGIELP